ncbi:MAG: hypothetical protein QNJ29_09155 [Rhizobiaceae bacterium]|nr:hypothetical protein [Rhizobiaceae bacterium]
MKISRPRHFKSQVIRLFSMLLLTFSLAANSMFSGADASERHIGYYYPEITSEESYQAPLPVLPGVSRLSRVGFVTELDQRQKKKPYPPTHHMYAKGGNAEKLIIVSTETGRYDTLFKMRGLLASMTADARTSPLFQKLGHVEQLNFFDLLKMAGFSELVVTNGHKLAHRVVFQ